MKIIGLSGRKRSGKDTVCQMLSETMPFAVIRLAFADDLKREVAQACGVTVNFIETHKENFRLILQGWGTDFRREIYGRQYWVHRMERSIHRVMAASKDPRLMVCVTDVRFPNEAELIHKFDGKVGRVTRPQADRSDDAHPSETALDEFPFDFVIENSSTLEDLKSTVNALAETL